MLKVDLPMAIRQWTSDLSVNQPDMDLQHQKLFDLMAFLYSNADAAKIDIDRAVKSLIDYTYVHFAQEEAYLKSISYPNIEIHRNGHKYIFSIVDKLVADLSMGDQRLFVKELYNLISEWLVNHIIHEDMAYARYASGLSNGKSAPGIQYDPL